MKNMILILISWIILSFNHCNANQMYPDYINGDMNYILCDMHMDAGWYVIKNSITVEKYEPPQYIIIVDVATVPKASYTYGNTKISSIKKYRFFYNWDLKEMYVDKTIGTSDWSFIEPRGPWAKTGIIKYAGEMAFYISYNKKFYALENNNEFYTRIENTNQN